MVLCLFALFIGNKDPITVELMAIDKACSLCESNSLLHDTVIEIVSDSLVAVSWINVDSIGSLDHVDLIYGIREIIRFHGSLAIRFSSRALNSYADRLAKNGSNMEGDVLQWSNV